MSAAALLNMIAPLEQQVMQMLAGEMNPFHTHRDINSKLFQGITNTTLVCFSTYQ